MTTLRDFITRRKFSEGDEKTVEQQVVKTIGIVGGGRVGLKLFELFRSSSFCRVAFISDINASAPALAAAQKAGVRTFTDLQAALNTPVDYIFEVTGRDEVAQAIQSNGACGRMITHDMAQVILQTVEENNQRVKSSSVHEIQQIQADINSHLERLNQFVGSIAGILADMNMLSINARIEAARVGAQGRGFEVVAAEMGKSAEAVRQITSEIEQIARAITQTSGRIDSALQKLQ
jgi:methyl-accepting chemotaxis protein